MAKDSPCSRLYGTVSGLCMECIIAVLVVVDGLAITAELLIRLDILQVPGGAPTDPPITSTQNASTPVNATPTQDPDPGGSICRRCVNMVEPIEITYCVAHYASVVIAGVFIVEVLLRVVSGRSKVFKDLIEICDSLIVVVLVAMEILFTLFWDDVLCYHPAVEAATYIVFFRLCRVPRACTVSKRVFSDKVDIELHYLMKAKKKAEEKGAELREKVDKQQREIDFLQNQLKETKVKISTTDRGSSEFCNGHVSDGTEKSSTKNIENLYAKPIKRPKVNGDVSQHNTDLNPGGYTTIIHTTYQGADEVNKTDGAGEVKVDNHLPSQASASEDTSDVIDSPPHDVKESRVVVGAGPHGDSCSLDARNSAYDSSDSAYLVDDFQKRKKVQRSRSDSALSTESKIAIRQLDIAIDPGLDHRSGGVDNKSYVEDEDEAVQMRRLSVMAEYEGTRTYRSAEGVPLTEL
ncbi:uncharacterized protein LOC110445651 [Mizuhopecten yessoensis]|uniref:Hydrogen voltage-gated channel 1 n=1 Tax=Mizuhopecten yessoensis TaxID=6573 RepID=A0A210QZ74_MIZYE|nr:uncharacterized protein LOC110445651 [Mizuhopecten yessoensis]OWF54068.1 hypothetical protein KP79_PYT15251 [Mizuhopecten yessoensis]